MTDLPDTRRSLLLRLQDVDDGEAWHELVSVYETAIYRYVRSRGLQHADVQEVVQDVFLAVYRSLPKFSPERDGSFRSWLFRVAFCKSATLARRRSRLEQASGRTTALEALTAHPVDVVDDSATEWQRWAFYWAAGRVQQQVRHKNWQIFWKTTVEQQSATDVARQLQTSVGAVYAAKCRVLARIRNEVRKFDRDAMPADENANGGYVPLRDIKGETT